MTERASFLDDPPLTDDVVDVFDADRDGSGYVHNWTRLWSWRPDVLAAFAAVRRELMNGSSLSEREWAVLVTATVSELNDSYCSLAWGTRLANLVGDAAAADVIAGVGAPALTLTEREVALEAWARQVVRDPNATTDRDVARLREAGLDDRQIFEATSFVAFRIAFSTINDALGAAPDKEVADAAAAAVRAAVTYGRAPSTAPSLR